MKNEEKTMIIMNDLLQLYRKGVAYCMSQQRTTRRLEPTIGK